MHLRRILTGLAFTPIFLIGVFWSQGVWFAAAVVLFFCAAGRAELYGLLELRPGRVLSWWQNILAALLLVAATYQHSPTLAILAFLFFWGSCLLTIRPTFQGCRAELAGHAFVLLYLIVPLAALVYLRAFEHGSAFLFFALAVSCITDVGAFYGGRYMGRTPLAPILSPKKTWEGAAAGLAACLVFVLGCAWIHRTWSGDYALWLNDANWWYELTLVTIVMSIIGQVGDLFESALKRDHGVKDSGETITGHGGYLDMIDALLWIGPAMLVYVAWIL